MKRVDKIIKTFTKAIKKLERVEKDSFSQATGITGEIDNLCKYRAKVLYTGKKAGEIKNNIKNLLGV